jgi:putative oxidoreductase
MASSSILFFKFTKPIPESYEETTMSDTVIENTAAISPSFLSKAAHFIDSAYYGLDLLAPISFLLLRCWVAWQFFKSGLVKLQSFDSALMLFEYEYAVPLLSPTIAAYMATVAELVLPILLIIGLAGRISALGLFILNVVAYISYADALLTDHLPWGLILLLFTFSGPGKLSLDYFISRFVSR